MSPRELVESLTGRGIVLVPAGDGRLRYRPAEAVSEPERADLARHRQAILAWFDADPIGWRAAIIATQVPASGAIPLLLARPGIRFPQGSCCSCGDRLGADDRYRCRPCAEAAVRALAAVPSAGLSA